MLSLAPALALGLVLGPMLAGVAATILPAAGYDPATGLAGLGLAPWHDLFAAPGIWAAVRLSLTTGLAATAISLAIVAALGAAFHDSRLFRLARRALGPLLAVPHAAIALGLAFLLAPSGWLLRLLTPWATALDAPPDLTLIQDRFGFALILGLVVKETPFLLLMTLAALGQTDARRSVLTARALGYRPAAAWLWTVWPRVYRQLRLPVFAVLAFSISVVDMALILGPNTPPPLAVLVTRWAGDPATATRLQAGAGACLLLALTLAAIASWIGAERAAGWLARRLRSAGRRGAPPGATVFALTSSGGILLLAAGALAGMGLWSVADSWRFPDALPDRWSLDRWADSGALARPFLNTALLGLAAAGIATVVVLACLEHESRRGGRARTALLWLAYAPLLLPQVGFLFGVRQLLAWLGLDGTGLAVLWAHLVFVLPYVFLSLADPARALDPRYGRIGACLGATPARVFWRIRLPLLLRPVLIAAAVGFAVSVAQYLATLFAGAGRVPTLTTEAVALASGGDRRVIGVYAIAQTALPFAGFALALSVPAWLYRHRAGMRAFR